MVTVWLIPCWRDAVWRPEVRGQRLGGGFITLDRDGGPGATCASGEALWAEGARLPCRGGPGGVSDLASNGLWSPVNIKRSRHKGEAKAGILDRKGLQGLQNTFGECSPLWRAGELICSKSEFLRFTELFWMARRPGWALLFSDASLWRRASREDTVIILGRLASLRDPKTARVGIPEALHNRSICLGSSDSLCGLPPGIGTPRRKSGMRRAFSSQCRHS